MVGIVLAKSLPSPSCYLTHTTEHVRDSVLLLKRISSPSATPSILDVDTERARMSRAVTRDSCHQSFYNFWIVSSSWSISSQTTLSSILDIYCSCQNIYTPVDLALYSVIRRGNAKLWPVLDNAHTACGNISILYLNWSIPCLTRKRLIEQVY